MAQNSSKKIFISTGEVSGDLQGSLLIAALHRQAANLDWELEIVALGGQRMAKAGATLLGDTSAVGSVGIIESLPYFIPTLQLQRQAKKYLEKHPPDLAILIDYMGPNLGVGSYLRRSGLNVPVVYYIAPQEWVWSVNERNTNLIKGMTDRILAIFPEEARYFAKKGASVTWVGHPLIDRMQNAPKREEARKMLAIASDEIAIALIPASRTQELKYLLPVICAAAQQLQAQIPQVRFFIPLSLEAFRPIIEQAIKDYNLRATLVFSQTQEVLAAADLAITKSGTVNLELALLNVPQLVIYRLNSITAWIGRRLLKLAIPFMSPVNLVNMKAIVPELQQEAVTAENIVATSLELLFNQERRQKTLTDYQEMRELLGEPGVCDRAALEILNLLKTWISPNTVQLTKFVVGL